jgi:hypothetical protein
MRCETNQACQTYQQYQAAHVTNDTPPALPFGKPTTRLSPQALHDLKVELRTLRSALGHSGERAKEERNDPVDRNFQDNGLSVMQLKQALKEIRGMCET